MLMKKKDDFSTIDFLIIVSALKNYPTVYLTRKYTLQTFSFLFEISGLKKLVKCSKYKKVNFITEFGKKIKTL